MSADFKANTRTPARISPDPPAPECVSELLILPDGRVLVHNLTPAFAALLHELNPADEQIRRRTTVPPAPPPAIPAEGPDNEK